MTRIPHYEDFALGFTADPNDQDLFSVTIRQAPVLGRGASFRLPFPARELEPLLTRLEQQIVGEDFGRTSSPLDGEAVDSTPEELGNALFRALFQGDIRDSFLPSQREASRKPNTGLRLRLVIDTEAPGGALLASLPWELLFRWETRDHFSRNLQTPVVRFLLTPVVPRPLTLGDDLRILLVSSNPVRSTPLDLASEASRFEEAWAGRGLEVHHLKSPSMLEQDLHRAVRKVDPHVLHLMGHGTFDDRTGDGGLLLDDGYGRAQLYTAELLRQDARAGSSLRFVCLNTCQSGRLPRRKGQDPFSGLASSLVLAGVPAVAAMQFPISDEAALAFSTGLYRALAAGDPVDAAVTEGRMAIFAQNQSSWEWATPALYLSVPDGRLFSTKRGGSEEPLMEGERPEPPRDWDPPSIGTVKEVENFIVGQHNVIGTLNNGGGHPSRTRKDD